MTKPDSPFARDKAEFRRLAAQVLEVAAAHLESLPVRPVDRPMSEAARRRVLDQPLPDDGLSADAIVEFLRDHVMPYPLPTGHPRSYGWINSPPAPIGILADTLSTALNASSDGYDHSGVFLLACVSRWLMELFEFPREGAMGLLLSGGSAANLNALAVARFHAARRAGFDVRRQGLQGAGPRLRLYTSPEAHSSIQKCVEMLGLGAESIRTVPADEAFRMRPDRLRAMLREDLDRGDMPCCVVAACGATNTGAIDSLDEIADIAKEHGVWLHVDGAYGALGILDPSYRERCAGIARADTLTFNPHKWLMTPIDCGALLIRDKRLHREAFSLVPAYLAEGGSEEAPWAYEYSFELTYANRAVKTWATLARLGRNGAAELVVRCNRLAERLAVALEAEPDFELTAPSSLSVVCFRYRPLDSAHDKTRLDALNAALSEAMAASGEAHMPVTKVRGRTSLRACFLHYENDAADVEHLIGLMKRLAAAL